MKYLFYIYLIIIISSILSCAKQSAPLGGPKDEDAPELLSINPVNESTNTKPSTIILEFSEYVRTETPNKLILITPRINKDDIEVTANRNKVTINLNQELEDSTTYVFNFQKSIKDITEGNVPENLRLVFSTGPTIDSLSANGKVSFNFPQNTPKLEDVLVGLYPLDDTTNVFTGPPYYVVQTDSTGLFTLRNLKQGKYLSFAWEDANNNNKAEFKTEPYSFIIDTINLESDITGLNFILDKSDLSPFKIQRTATIGQNFEITTTKAAVNIEIQHEDLGKDMFYAAKEKSIRFYHQTLSNDSTAVRIQLADSAGIQVDSTLYLKFQESDRKKDTPIPSFGNTKTFTKNIQAQILFNKPIVDINYDSLFVKYDTINNVQITPQMLSFEDSLQRTSISLLIPIPDSVASDSFTLYIGDSTFKDVEGVWTDKKYENTYTKINPETLAEEIKVTVNTEERPLIIQILTKKDEIIRQAYLENTNTTTFKNIEAGTYVIRAVVDRNKNKRWDTSNYLDKRYAEPIYFLTNPENPEPYDTIIRGGWTLEVTIEPRNGPGIMRETEKKPE
ncbi:Ig-like domain-containing protein [Mariniradius sediminis]|uniref:Ig-like domain-containing protein n=1 Tax=Mariniradius sediminis TaxID=2909237 RepID=A0ABS9C0P1_9BACT|nr:Ig-like domain-containing protein [Mariniradius sediminis]MCF1753237.1 Ig-like domain-containing protein [Mariniradius sediminis]